VQRFREQLHQCDRCSAACSALLAAGSGTLHPDLVSLLVDTEQACSFAASQMARQSESLKQACGLCADICQTCANALAETTGERFDEVARICQETAGVLHLLVERVPRLGSRASASAHERYAG
jgi:epoxyqueuosine reductase QueG